MVLCCAQLCSESPDWTRSWKTCNEGGCAPGSLAPGRFGSETQTADELELKLCFLTCNSQVPAFKPQLLLLEVSPGHHGGCK